MHGSAIYRGVPEDSGSLPSGFTEREMLHANCECEGVPQSKTTPSTPCHTDLVIHIAEQKEWASTSS